MRGARAIATLAATAAALCAGACGDGDETASEAEVRTAFLELRQAFDAEDFDGVCARLSRAAVRQIGTVPHGRPRDCWVDVAEFTQRMREGAPERQPDAPAVVDVDVEGDRATVMAKLSASSTSRVRFVREEGEWKLASVYGNTAPPPKDLG